MTDLELAFNDDFERGRFEFIQAELHFAQDRLRDAAVELAHEHTGRAKELWDTAKHSYDKAVAQLPKLSPHIDRRSLAALAALLAEDIRVLGAQIHKQRR